MICISVHLTVAMEQFIITRYLLSFKQYILKSVCICRRPKKRPSVVLLCDFVFRLLSEYLTGVQILLWVQSRQFDQIFNECVVFSVCLFHFLSHFLLLGGRSNDGIVFRRASLIMDYMTT